MTIEETLAERGKTHGDFDSNSAVAQQLKNIMRSGPMWHAMTFAQREAVDMICHKLARAVSGNPSFADHWHDIIGYAKLVEDRCNAHSSQT